MGHHGLDQIMLSMRVLVSLQQPKRDTVEVDGLGEFLVVSRSSALLELIPVAVSGQPWRLSINDFPFELSIDSFLNKERQC